MLAWMLLGSAAAHSAGTQTITLAAPTFVGVAKSMHNDGLAKPADACPAPVPLQPGDEHSGDLNGAKGSFLEFVRFPNAATVKSVSLYANDFDGAANSHAYLIRKLIKPGTHPKETGYLTMAHAQSAGAVDSVIRKFNAPGIKDAHIDNTNFEYFAELVVCPFTEPFAVQIVYTT